MRAEFLPFSPPSIGAEEIEAVAAALGSGWITTGPRVREFEAAFAECVGAPAALAVSSGTAALHVSLLALGIGPGTAVVGTPMTFASSINVIEHAGARPVLVDVQADSLNIDPQRVAEAVARDPEIRALMPVHLYGQPCDLDPLLEIARAHGLGIVEDAAHSLPAAYGGRQIGSPLDATGGVAEDSLGRPYFGAVVVSRDAHQRYSAQGSWYYEVVRAGFKYNMPDIQAALGLQQLRRLPAFSERRRAAVRRYDAAFSGIPEVETPTVRPNRDHAWHIYALRLNLERLNLGRGLARLC